MTMIYFSVLCYMIYYIKRCEHRLLSDGSKVTYAVLWILIELMIWYLQFFSGVVFMAASYLFTLDNFMRDQEELETDDNPWNNRDTEDYLRHLKPEFFFTTYQMIMLGLNVTINFLPNFFWI